MSLAVTNFWLVPAPLSVLFFLAAGGLTGLLLAAAAVAGLAGKGRLASRLFGGGVAVPVLYGTALFLVGFSTPERTLAAGSGKYLCEIDCHLVYSVAGVDHAPASRTRRVLRLVTRFDERTIAPWRGNAPLTRWPGRIELVDRRGLRFLPVTEGWESAVGAPIRPGESRETAIAFDVPEDAGALRLFVGVSKWPCRLLVGCEEAPLAGRLLLTVPS
jgi:hypothetical protein